MYVLKRDGRKEIVHFDKITSRINKLCYGLDPVHVDAAFVSQKVVQGVYPGVTTIELDELAAQTAASCATRHPDFSILAARISVSNLQKQTSKIFSEVVEILHKNVHPKTGEKSPLVSDTLYDIVMKVKIFFKQKCLEVEYTHRLYVSSSFSLFYTEPRTTKFCNHIRSRF